MTEPSRPEDQTQPGSQPSGEARQAALSKELSQFLLELSIGVHRFGMYPQGHPSLWSAAENVVGRLGILLRKRDTLSIGVAHDQLVIQGVPTDPNQPVLSDLARRLHRHQVGAVSFRRGVDQQEVEELLLTLASESEKEEDIIGLRPPEDLPAWEHVRILPVGYDQVELEKGRKEEDDREPSRADQLWIGLAQAALAGEEELDPASPPGARLVAESINSHRPDGAYAQVIVGYLHQLAQEVSAGEGGEIRSVRERVSELIRELDQETLRRLVELGGDAARRKRFVLEANQSLTVESVVKIVTAAAHASGQAISGSLTRLLSKMAAHAERGPGLVRSQADTALRDDVQDLISGWDAEESRPEEYNLILDAMSRSSPIFQGGGDDDGDEEVGEPQERGPGRLLVMALEIDALGPMVEKAVSELLEQEELGWMLRTLDGAPEGSRVAALVEEKISVPEHVSRLLSGTDVEEDTLVALVERIGAEAVQPLMDALTESDSRSIRRKVFDCLTGLDPDRFPVVEKATEGLSDPRWYVKRNMLGLLQELDSGSGTVSGLEYLRHSEARVRREAFLVAVNNPEERDEAVELALADPDERLVRMALLNAQEEGITEEGARIVCERLVQRRELSELRFLGVRVLRDSEAPAALTGLVGVADGGRTFWGRRKLAEKSSELLVALSGLAERWSEDSAAQRLLKLAGKSKDREIQNAASGGASS